MDYSDHQILFVESDLDEELVLKIIHEYNQHDVLCICKDYEWCGKNKMVLSQYFPWHEFIGGNIFQDGSVRIRKIDLLKMFPKQLAKDIIKYWDKELKKMMRSEDYVTKNYRAGKKAIQELLNLEAE